MLWTIAVLLLVLWALGPARLDEINEVFARMERGQIDGRVVIDYR